MQGSFPLFFRGPNTWKIWGQISQILILSYLSEQQNKSSSCVRLSIKELTSQLSFSWVLNLRKRKLVQVLISVLRPTFSQQWNKSTSFVKLRTVELIVSISSLPTFSQQPNRGHTCKRANSWRILSGIWRFALKNLRASEQYRAWSGVGEILGGDSAEKSNVLGGETEEEAVRGFPAEVAAIADLRPRERMRLLKTFPVVELFSGYSLYWLTGSAPPVDLIWDLVESGEWIEIGLKFRLCGTFLLSFPSVSILMTTMMMSPFDRRTVRFVRGNFVDGHLSLWLV